MNQRFLTTSILILFVGSAFAQKINASNIEYREGSTTLEGYKAYDESKTGKRPGILVVHDWTGLDDFEKDRTRQIAEMGYVALAADIYGKGVRPKNMQENAAEAGKYYGDLGLFRARLKAGLEELKRDPNIDASKIAVIGYCFGGSGALELARSGADFAGAVSIHGLLNTKDAADARNIKAKVLVLHGAIDPYVPDVQLLGFVKEMEDAKVDYQLISYGGAVHAFTEPHVGSDKSTGAAYDARADKRAWQHLKMFFDEIFKG